MLIGPTNKRLNLLAERNFRRNAESWSSSCEGQPVLEALDVTQALDRIGHVFSTALFVANSPATKGNQFLCLACSNTDGRRLRDSRQRDCEEQDCGADHGGGFTSAGGFWSMGQEASRFHASIASRTKIALEAMEQTLPIHHSALFPVSDHPIRKWGQECRLRNLVGMSALPRL